MSTPPSRARTGSRRSCGPGCSDRCRPRRWSSSWSAAACRSSAILLRLFPWALLPARLAAVLAFKRVRGWPLHELIPLKVVVAAPPRGTSLVPTGPAAGARRASPPTALPPNHARAASCSTSTSSWVATPGRLAGVGVVHDIGAGLLTAVLRVTGDGQFTLTSAASQDTRVALWGDALAAFCRERADRVPRRVAGVVDVDRRSKRRTSRRRARAGSMAEAAADYAELVTHAAPRAGRARHAGVADGRPGAMPTRRTRPVDAVAGGLQTAGRGAAAVHRAAGGGRPARRSAPLTPAEMTMAVRLRSTPFAETQQRALVDVARRGSRRDGRRPGADGGRRGVGARACRSGDPPVVVGRGLAALRGAGGVDGPAAARRRSARGR